ncbi:L-cystatin-like isoform X2 [Amphibalanus amphitrite]|uniref:L-cystatin-like isoform X2 n=1 Tax=Amphibalanus amphitrite TaxID=1232801 RepID=UPI001C900B30|nr:L-cystatin-like isoform X2 [Amphibalanus amphitrite]
MSFRRSYPDPCCRERKEHAPVPIGVFKMKLLILTIVLQAAWVHTNDPPVPGGYISVPVDRDDVQEMARFAEPHLQSEIAHHGYFLLETVDKAETQVVAGTNYRLTLTLAKLLWPMKASVECNVIVFDQSWTNTRRVTSKSCGPIQFRAI